MSIKELARQHKLSDTAIHKCAKAKGWTHGLTIQTIGDGCRRRLGLNKINELYELLGEWVQGDPRGLVRQLKENSDPSSHAEIEQFFSGGDAAPAEPQGSSNDETEIFEVRLREPTRRMLKALAELEGVSPSELIAAAVRDRMAIVARGIIKKR